MMDEQAVEASREPPDECPTCSERGYDNADYQRLHRVWCESVAENERLRKALRDLAETYGIAELMFRRFKGKITGDEAAGMMRASIETTLRVRDQRGMENLEHCDYCDRTLDFTTMPGARLPDVVPPLK